MKHWETKLIHLNRGRESNRNREMTEKHCGKYVEANSERVGEPETYFMLLC